MYRRKYLSIVALIVCLAYIGAQLKVSAKSPTGKRQKYVATLLEALDDDKYGNKTTPNLHELRIKIGHGTHNTVEFKFNSFYRERKIEKKALDLIIDSLENALLEAEAMGYPIKCCENDGS